MANNTGMIEQSILAQQVYLDIVRSRHLQWASSTEDPEIKRVHIEIAQLIQQTREQYYELLMSYHERLGEYEPVTH